MMMTRILLFIFLILFPETGITGDTKFYFGLNTMEGRNITHDYSLMGGGVDFKYKYYWILYSGIGVKNFMEEENSERQYSLEVNFLELRYSLWTRYITTLGTEGIVLYSGADYLFLFGEEFDTGIEFHAGINVYWILCGFSYFYLFADSSHNISMVYGIRFSW